MTLSNGFDQQKDREIKRGQRLGTKRIFFLNKRDNSTLHVGESLPVESLPCILVQTCVRTF